jgi:hypothetical protein
MALERHVHIVALRQDGRTWPEIAAAVGLSQSRVRDIYAKPPLATHDESVSDAVLVANLRLFLAECPGHRPSRRAYARWPRRVASPATVENRFGSWSRALAYAQHASRSAT